MAEHAVITAALSMPVFFCDPHHPWQRGTNENINRLLRQYLHKNADLRSFTQDDLDAIAAISATSSSSHRTAASR